MSYILEALKKAQAERQLGDTPSIHAAPLHSVSAADVRGGGWQRMLIVGALALGAVAALAYVLVNRQMEPLPAGAGPTAAASSAAAMPAVAPVASPPAVALPTAAAPAAAQQAASSGGGALPADAPVANRPAVALLTAAALAAAQHAAVRPGTAPAGVASAKPVVAAADEGLPGLRDLPEAVQRAVPTLSFGGYIYSANPADRIILVDKVLRHEGDEVAPGLILEKLLPRAAILNYRGTRYRAPY